MADIDAPLSWRMQQDGYLMQIDQLRTENAKLQDENERLRSCLSDDADNARQIMAENAGLREQYEAVIADYRSEVAKLRELVRDLLARETTCYTAGIIMRKRARELGVDDV